MNKYKIAYQKAEEVLQLIKENGSIGVFVPLNDIISAVKKVSGFSKIVVERSSFKDLRIPGEEKDSPQFGAMLSTETSNTNGTIEKHAELLINSDYEPNMQRFSLVHELGHLVTNVPNFTYEKADDNQYTISAHINPDITYISTIDEDDGYLIAEQIANIFALLVLVPQDIKIRDLKEIGASELANKYGVTEDAIYSRMLLSSANRSYYG